MTFQEGRDRLLTQYDAAVVVLRSIVADPTWTNDGYRPFTDAMAKLVSTIRQLQSLNEAEESARKLG